MTKRIFFLLSLVFIMGLVACGDEQAAQEDKEGIHISTEDGKESINVNIDLSDEKESIENAFNEAKDAIGNLNININKNKKNNDKNENVEVISYRELKKQFPSRIGGLKLEDTEGETTGFMGIKFSKAEATYLDDEERLNIAIIDAGGITSLIGSFASWSDIEIDKESDDGYEYTTTIDGYKAYQKYEKRQNKSSLSVIVEDRFIVTLEGKGVEMSELERAFKKLDIDDLL